MLTRLSGIAEQARTVQQEITLLLSLWEVRKGDIVRRWHEKEDVNEIEQTICHMKEQDSFLSILATTQLSQGKQERALETWEQLLVIRKTLKSLIDDKNKDDGDDDDDEDDCDIDLDIKNVARAIRDMKATLGLIERSDEYCLYYATRLQISSKKITFSWQVSSKAIWQLNCYGIKNHPNMKRQLAF